MIKRLLSVMLFLLAVGTLSAQAPMRLDLHNPQQRLTLKKPDPKNLKKVNKPHSLKRVIELGSGQEWFGYGNDEVADNMGLGMNCDNSLAIYIPYDRIAGKGATVDGIRFLLSSTKAKDITAWVGTKLPSPENYTKGADLEVKEVPLSDVVLDGYTEVAFSKSYEIPEGGLWVGYSFVIEGMEDMPDDSEVSDDDFFEWYINVYWPWMQANYDDAYPFFVSDLDVPIEGSMMFGCKAEDDLYRQYAEIDPANADSYLSYVGWVDYSPYGYAIALNALIGGGKFNNNAVIVDDFGQQFAMINETVTVPVTLTNRGKNGVSDLTYEVTINGEKVDEQTVYLKAPVEKILGKTSIDLTIPTGNKAGVQKFVITVTKVNGEANEVEAVAKGTIVVLAESAKMKPLVEEFTGTWCGWCTRGWVAMEMLTRDFKDDAVIYAIHNSDPMEIDAFVDVVDTYADGFPSLSINRKRFVDPYYGSTNYPYDVKFDVEESKTEIAPASIAVKATWTDDSKTKINIETETTVMYDDEDPSIAIGYVLVADGLKGTGRAWAQANYYAGDTDIEPDLQKLAGMGDYITDMEYNHVAVAAWGAERGVEGSIKGAVKAAEPVVGHFEADLNGLLIGTDRNSSDPDDHVTVLDLIKDKKLHVVAFLINTTSGEVINADEVLLDEGNPSGIKTVSDETDAALEYFNISGMRMNAPQKGLNIIRLSNGKSVKVVVK
ncbi:MAG: hypothetical protein J6T94_08410 [Bacteroidaceae bacterium]|nr:hypothetical protein [Bacteroidaceae bacterium]